MIQIALHKFVEEFPNESKIGLIATEGSIYDHLYEDELHKLGKKVEFGGPEIQPMVNDLIYRNIKEQGKIDSKLYHNILKKMHDNYGCNVVLLGCTELSLAQEKVPDHPYQIIDPQSIMADITIELALKIRKGMDAKKACASYLYQD